MPADAADTNAEAAGSDDEQDRGNEGSMAEQEANKASVVTDVVEERELSVADGMASAMEDDEDDVVAESEARAKREAELKKVEVDAADVALIAAELELSSADADRALREAGGDVAKALAALLACAPFHTEAGFHSRSRVPNLRVP